MRSMLAKHEQYKEESPRESSGELSVAVPAKIGQRTKPRDNAEQEWAPICSKKPRVLVAEGTYQAGCVSARRFEHPIFKRKIIALRFSLLEDEFLGVELERYFPASNRVGRHSNLYREWTVANDGIPPRRRQRMPLGKFVGKIFLVRVVTVERAWDKRLFPPALRYSKVGEILELSGTNECTNPPVTP